MVETGSGAAESGAEGERVPVAVDGAAEVGGGAELPTVRGEHEHLSSATRHLVLPETFDATGSWNDWCFHFENVASVNGWNSTQKLQWLRCK